MSVGGQLGYPVGCIREFDKVYGPAWHCIVGSNFGSFVTHATGCFLYFSMEKLYILVFKTKVKKSVN
ncbi:putative dynein ATPase [Helianthus debilis subsp. tardiflorus]